MSYKQGNIYKIICKLDSSIVYIGSTFKELRKRWYCHKKHYNDKYGNLSIWKYFDKYGIDNFKIIHIKSYVCYREHNRDCKHLHAYETLWINKTKNCCNEILPFNPMKFFNLKKYQQEYREKNKDKLKEYNKKYQEENKELIKKKRKEYFNKNKDKLNEKQRENRKENPEKYKQQDKNKYEKHKDKINEKKKEKITCECGSCIRKSDLARHLKTNKHVKYIENKN
jgi:hypothetical protein